MVGLYRRTPCHSVLAPSRDDVSEIVTFSAREYYSLTALRGSRTRITGRRGRVHAIDLRCRRRGARRAIRDLTRRASAGRSRHGATLTLILRRPAVGAAVAATPVRSRLAGARQPARVRRPQRYGAAAVRARRGVVPPTYLPKLQSAGRRDHRRVALVVWDVGTEAALGGADFAGRDHRVAGNERT